MPKRKNSTKRSSAEPDLTYIADALRPLAVPIASLVFDPRNAKKHAERDLSAIAASLRNYGICKPAVVRRSDRRILAGNGAVQAAAEICRYTHFPVVFVDHDDNTALGFAIADNRTAELAEWDVEQLRALLDEVDYSGDDELVRLRDDFLAELDQLARDAADIASGVGAADDDAGQSARKPARKSSDTDPEGSVIEKWQIVITCTDEQHQTELLERFEAEGLTCRALVS
jgi:ParB-like chromosome segregation protein Spo0J